MQSKRELFFKNELPTTNTSAAGTPVTTLTTNSIATPTKPDVLNGNTTTPVTTSNSNLQTPTPSTIVNSVHNKENYVKKPERSKYCSNKFLNEYFSSLAW